MPLDTRALDIIDGWERKAQNGPLTILQDRKVVWKHKWTIAEAKSMVVRIRKIISTNIHGSKPNATHQYPRQADQLLPILEGLSHPPPGAPHRPPPEAMIHFIGWNGWSPEDEAASLPDREKVNAKLLKLITRIVDRSS